MAWTAPKTFVTGEAITAGDLNLMSQQIEQLKPVTAEIELVKAEIEQLRKPRRPGRPLNPNGKCARAHVMRVHQEMEIDQIAQALYREYDRGPDEARRKARRAVSWGKRNCPDCV